jgi:BolA protein
MSINQARIARFKEDLAKVFDIQKLVIEDESHLHAGHAGAATGGGHFKVTIVAPQFQGLSRIARHRAVYEALYNHIPTEIHALTISASSPEELTF